MRAEMKKIDERAKELLAEIVHDIGHVHAEALPKIEALVERTLAEVKRNLPDEKTGIFGHGALPRAGRRHEAKEPSGR